MGGEGGGGCSGWCLEGDLLLVGVAKVMLAFFLPLVNSYSSTFNVESEERKVFV
jgi:hypothetical protein